jgi:hypothetical protein
VRFRQALLQQAHTITTLGYADHDEGVNVIHNKRYKKKSDLSEMKMDGPQFTKIYFLPNPTLKA